MLVGLAISFMALIGFVFAIVLLLAAAIRYGVFLFSTRQSTSRAKHAISYIFFKDQSDDLSIAKLFYLSVFLSVLAITMISILGG